MDKKEMMFELVKQWRKSSVTRKVFASEHGITEASFDYWCSKHDIEHKLQVTQPGFIEIASPKPITHEKLICPQIELELPSGLRIKIY
jgi:hypothetical protein